MICSNVFRLILYALCLNRGLTLDFFLLYCYTYIVKQTQPLVIVEHLNGMNGDLNSCVGFPDANLLHHLIPSQVSFELIAFDRCLITLFHLLQGVYLISSQFRFVYILNKAVEFLGYLSSHLGWHLIALHPLANLNIVKIKTIVWEMCLFSKGCFNPPHQPTFSIQTPLDLIIKNCCYLTHII